MIIFIGLQIYSFNILRGIEATGNFYIDDNVLKEEGVTEFDQYAVEPGLF